MLLPFLLVPLASLAAFQAVDDPPIDFDALARAFIEQHCPDLGDGACTLDDVLQADHVRLDVGAFGLEFPARMLSDAEGLEHLRDVVLGLANASEVWLRWQGVEPEEDLAKPLVRWTKKWKPLKAKDLDRRDSRQLVDLMPTDEKVRAALTRLVELADAEDLALRVPEGRQLRLMLAPTRLDFMRWNGFSGHVDADLQPVNWLADAHQWTQIWFGWDLVLALEYAPWTGYDPTFETGQPMARIGEGVMAQHVVQQSFLALLHSCRPDLPPSRHTGALAMLMTIQACGEINTIEGAGGVSSSGGRTNPYEKFVPGGNPAGGILPGRSASALDGLVENRWRKGHGEDGFRAPLKAGQKAGGKEVRRERKADRLAHFVLEKEDGTGEHLIRAPFFGPHADEQAYPPVDYLVDYAEFYRAYKTAFLHWLAEAGPDPKAADANWRRVVRGLATIDAERDFEALLEQVYGLPVSGRDGSTESLEWAFLRALPKLK